MPPPAAVDEHPTVIQRRPGVARRALPPLAHGSSAPPRPEADTAAQGAAGLVSLKPYRNRGTYAGNALIAAAETLLDLMIEVPAMGGQEAVADFQRRVVEEIDRFEAQAVAAGCDGDHVASGRYVLCSALDETVLMTPWGGESDWSRQSLLSTFHDETWGGERVFALLRKLREDPGRNRDVCELICLVLDLGFEGRYRVAENGHAELEDLRRELHREIGRGRGIGRWPLSIDWEGETTRRRLRRAVPTWVVLALTGVAILGMFAWFEVQVYKVHASIAEKAATVARSPPAR